MNFIKKYNFQLFILFSSLIVITIPVKESYNSITIILFLAYIIFNLIFVYKTKYKLSKEVVFFALPFIYITFQFFYSDLIEYHKNLLRTVPFILFPVFLSLIKNQYKNSVQIVLKTLVFSALGYSFFLILVAFYRQFDFSPNFSEINWYFFAYHDFTAALKVHPTYLGMYNCLAFSVILENVIYNKRISILNLIYMTVLIVVIILSGSRISLACLGIVFCYIFFSNFRLIEKKIKFIFILFFIVAPVIVFTFVPIAKERMIDMTLGLKETFSYAKYGNNIKFNGSLGPRLEIWECAIDITQNNCFFGNGFGNTQEFLNECYKNKGFDGFAKLNYQTHNQYLNNYARGGVLGLIILLAIFLIPLYYSIKNKDILYSSFLIIVIVSCFTENILNLHFGIVFYAFFNSFLFFMKNEKFKL